MNRYPPPGLRGRASSVAMLVAASSLLLAACGGGSSGSSGGSTSASPATSSGSATGSGSGSGGSTSVVSSASLPFPIAAGNTWVYKTTEATLSTTGKVTDKVLSITPVSGGQQVTMSNTDDIAGSSNTSQAVYVFHSDGSISYPLSQLNSPSASVTIVSGGLLWPSASAIASGKAYHSTLKIQFTTNGTKAVVTSHLTVQGGGTATVSVPAGNYTATIVNMTMASTVEGIPVTIEVKTWMANGVGPVQSEAISSEAGHSTVVSKQQLISFTKG
jgi:hypothetical protein